MPGDSAISRELLAAGETTNKATDVRDGAGLDGHCVPGNAEAWDDRSHVESDTRHRLLTDAAPTIGRQSEESGRRFEQADIGQQAASRMLVFVSEGATAIR